MYTFHWPGYFHLPIMTSYFTAPPARIPYGTAGFRMKAEKLEPVIFHVGVLASLRSIQKKKIVGVMITASHNGVQDNGVKIIEPNGDCLDIAWERYAERLVNESHSLEHFNEIVKSIRDVENISGNEGVVYIGYDTRPSRDILLKNLLDGVKAVECDSFHFGFLTTPQLHFMVKHDNVNGVRSKDEVPYYKKIAENLKVPLSRVIDCSHGVGAIAMKRLEKVLGYKLTLVNDDVDKIECLNHLCGAEYVQKEQKPSQIEGKILKETIASFDGDADRVVYSFYQDDKFQIIDGDKIASLIALFFAPYKNDLKIGCVQTAYANGASTKFLKSVLDHVVIEPTGVKYLHHRAQEFDVRNKICSSRLEYTLRVMDMVL